MTENGPFGIPFLIPKIPLKKLMWVPFLHSFPGNDSHKLFSGVENAPACYRAPRWPDPEFPRKIPKKYPPARNSGLPEFTPKIPRKYRKKYPQNTKNDRFWYFFGIFGVFCRGCKFSPWGLFFRYFLWKFRVGPSRGSVAGGGILNSGGPKLGVLGGFMLTKLTCFSVLKSAPVSRGGGQTVFNQILTRFHGIQLKSG